MKHGEKNGPQGIPIVASAGVRLRRTCAEDIHLWFRWANDPIVRANGFHPEPIPWETHLKWFEQHRQSPDSRLWIGLDLNDQSLGYVRLDRQENGEWEISVAVDAAFRNRGTGSRLVALALQKFARETESPTIMARIKPTNACSLKLFQAAGFEPDTARTTPDCCVFIRKLINFD